jgi:hypothetical protein
MWADISGLWSWLKRCPFFLRLIAGAPGYCQERSEPLGEESFHPMSPPSDPDSDISWGSPAFFIKFFYACFSDFFIEFYKNRVQAFIKIGMAAGKVFALIAEIHLFFLVATAYVTILEKFAVFVAASVTIFRRQIIQHFLEVLIFFKNRIVQKGFKPFGIEFEIPEFFL